MEGHVKREPEALSILTGMKFATGCEGTVACRLVLHPSLALYQPRFPELLGEDSDGGRSQARFLCLCACLREGLTCIVLKNDAFGSKYPWYLVRRFYGPRLTHSLPSPRKLLASLVGVCYGSTAQFSTFAGAGGSPSFASLACYSAASTLKTAREFVLRWFGVPRSEP